MTELCHWSSGRDRLKCISAPRPIRRPDIQNNFQALSVVILSKIKASDGRIANFDAETPANQSGTQRRLQPLSARWAVPVRYLHMDDSESKLAGDNAKTLPAFQQNPPKSTWPYTFQQLGQRDQHNLRSLTNRQATRFLGRRFFHSRNWIPTMRRRDFYGFLMFFTRQPPRVNET